jgi:hypothetical protein
MAVPLMVNTLMFVLENFSSISKSVTVLGQARPTWLGSASADEAFSVIAVIHDLQVVSSIGQFFVVAQDVSRIAYLVNLIE